MKPHRARAIKKEWGIKWRPATTMPKEAILNFTSPPASSCIKNNQCKVLGSKWFSILAASADAEISSPPHLFSVDQKARTRNGYLNQTSPFGGFHKTWGYQISKADDRASIARKRLSAVSTHLSCARFLPYWTGGFAVT